MEETIFQESENPQLRGFRTLNGDTGLLPPGLGSTICPVQKLEEMKPRGPQLEEVLGRKDYSEVPLGPYKSLHAGANGVKKWVQPHGSLPWLHYH